MKQYTIFTDKAHNTLFVVPKGSERIGYFYLHHKVMYWFDVQAKDEKDAQRVFDTVVRSTLQEV